MHFPVVPRWPSRPASSPPPPAQAWPTKPIRLVVPFPAGGGTDIITRELANKVDHSGYTFVVDNKPGSGGNLGVDAAAKSPRTATRW
jgi:tripartite-type tricarboxylate transporter receptor subunit TctC